MYRSFASCFGTRYFCKRYATGNQTREKEGRTCTTFNAWDADVLTRMDDFVSKEFPFILTKKAATCRTLVNRLADDLLEGKGFSVTSKSFEKAYSATYFPTPVKGQSDSVYYLGLVRSCMLYKVRSAAAEILRVPRFFCRGTSRTSSRTEF